MRKTTISESFSKFLTNLSHNLTFSLYSKLELSKINDYKVILGKNYELSSTSKEYKKNINSLVLNHYNNVIYFSYRINFPMLISNSKKSYISDTGWGCMLRSGQMLLYTVFVRHINKENKLNDQEKIDLIRLFLDDIIDPLEAPFSIQQIIPISNELFDLQPGEWFNANQILLVLQNCYDRFGSNGLINDFMIVSFLEGCIFVDEIVKKLGAKELCNNCSKIKFMLGNNKSLWKNLCEDCKKINKAGLITISFCLGIKIINSSMRDFVVEMLKIEQSMGALGGKGRKAYYIVGCGKKEFICKDPHYVQETIKEKNLAENLKSYYNNEENTIEIQYADSSITFAYYLRNTDDVTKFLQNIEEKESLLGDKWMLGLQDFYDEDELNKLKIRMSVSMSQFEENKSFDENEINPPNEKININHQYFDSVMHDKK